MLKKSIIALLFFISLSIFFITPVFADMMPIDDFRNFMLIGLVVILITNALFETLILFVLGLTKRKEVLTVMVANIISWPLFYFILMPEFSLTAPLLALIVPETIVVIFEALFIFLLNRYLKFKKLILNVLVANALSATIGSFIIYPFVIMVAAGIMSISSNFIKTHVSPGPIDTTEYYSPFD